MDGNADGFDVVTTTLEEVSEGTVSGRSPMTPIRLAQGQPLFGVPHRSHVMYALRAVF